MAGLRKTLTRTEAIAESGGVQREVQLLILHGFPSEAGGYFNFVAVPEVAGPHVGALEAASNTLGLCLYREFALGQDTAVAACSLQVGLVRVTRSLPVPPLAFSACTASLN